MNQSPVTAPTIAINRLHRAWRFKVTFAGSLTPKYYLSPDIRRKQPGWFDEIFPRPIEKMEFYLPTGHTIMMSGMEQYCFFVEATQNLSGGKARIEAAWLAGLLPGTRIAGGTVEMWRVGNSRVVRQRRPLGKEWGGTPISGWKPGAIGDRPVSILKGE